MAIIFVVVVLILDCVQLLLAAGLRPFISAVLNMLEIMVAALDLAITVVVLITYKLKLDLVGTEVQKPEPGIEVSPSCHLRWCCEAWLTTRHWTSSSCPVILLHLHVRHGNILYPNESVRPSWLSHSGHPKWAPWRITDVPSARSQLAPMPESAPPSSPCQHISHTLPLALLPRSIWTTLP